MRRRRTIKATLAVGLALTLVGLAAPPATAATADSIWGYFGPYAGYSYKNQAEISNSPQEALTKTYTQDGSYAPTGYIGGLARMYKGSALCKQNGYTYNTSASPWYNAGVTGNCGSGTYHSYGVSASYNGSGYNYTYTFVSPNVTF